MPEHATSNRLWSASCLKTFSQCPWRWWAEYEEKRPGAPVCSYQTGRETHTLLERYVKHLKQTEQPRDLARARDLATTAEDADARKTFLWYAEQAPTFETDRIAGVEVWMTAELPEGLGTFRGKIDLLSVDEELCEVTVTDWKGRYDWADPPDDPPDQLRYYAWLVSQQEAYERYEMIRMEQVNVGSVTSYAWDTFRPVSCAELADRIKLVRAEQRWLAEPGRHCLYCQYAATGACRKIALPEEWTDFQRMAGEQARLRAQANALTPILQEYVKQHGSQEFEGKPVGYLPTPEFKPKSTKRLLKQILDDEDEKALKKVGVTSAKCRDLAKLERYADLIEETEKVGWVL